MLPDYLVILSVRLRLKTGLWFDSRMLGIFRGVKDYVDNIKQIWDSSCILSFGVLVLQLFDNRKDERYCFTQIQKFTITLY